MSETRMLVFSWCGSFHYYLSEQRGHWSDWESMQADLYLWCVHILKAGTVKFLNFGTPEIFAVIYLKLKQRGQTLSVFCRNGANGIATSEDPDQTAPEEGAVWSGSALFAQTYLSENLGSLRYSHEEVQIQAQPFEAVVYSIVISQVHYNFRNLI